MFTKNMRCIVLYGTCFLLLLVLFQTGLNAHENEERIKGRSEFLHESFKELGEKVSLSTVAICSEGKIIGSGGCVSTEGFIVTAESVVNGKNNITVKFADGTLLKAEVLGIDRVGAVALLKVSESIPNTVSIPERGNVTTMQNGAFVICGSVDSDSFSVGVLSASKRNIKKLSPDSIKRLEVFGGVSDEFSGPHRTYREIIQHDAPVKKEVFGSPLFDKEGKLIGVNITTVFRGVCLAVPISRIEKVIPALKLGAILTEEPYFGFTADVIKGGSQTDVLVKEIKKDSPASKAGLLKNDIITAVDDESVSSIDALSELLKPLLPDVGITLKINRSNKILEIDITAGRKAQGRVEVIISGTSDAKAIVESLKENRGIFRIEQSETLEENQVKLTVLTHLSVDSIVVILKNLDNPYVSDIVNVENSVINTRYKN
ncbi:MAG: trypsin-like peptidase domain-containing protein [Planctomycetota bacterium]